MNKKFNLRKLIKAGYRLSKTYLFDGDSPSPFCILCNTINELNVTAFWVNPKEKRVFVYTLCKECAKEFFSLSKNDRKSIVANVIEKKIMSLPNRKLSEFVGEKNAKHK